MQKSTFMTNTEPKNAEIILQAAKDTNFPIFIEKEAYSQSGKLIPEYVSVHSSIKGQDHTIFWNRYRELNNLSDSVNLDWIRWVKDMGRIGIHNNMERLAREFLHDEITLEDMIEKMKTLKTWYKAV